MVLQKRLDYGFNGYHTPFVPRRTRSSRRRGSIRNKNEDNTPCAFDLDLLATLAEKLLAGEEVSDTATNTALGIDQHAIVNSDKVHEPKSIKGDTADWSCARESKDSPLKQNDVCSGLASASGCSKNDSAAGSPAACNIRNVYEGFTCKVELGECGYSKSSECGLGDETEKGIKAEPVENGKLSIKTDANMGKPIPSSSSADCAKFYPCNDPVPCGHILPSGVNVNIMNTDDVEKYVVDVDINVVGNDDDDKSRFYVNVDNRNDDERYGLDVKLVSKDDDEKFRASIKLVNRSNDEKSSGGTAHKTFGPPTCTREGRIRKLLKANYLKAAPRLKAEVMKTSREFNHIYHIRKSYFKRHSSRINYPSKKRRLLSVISNAGRGICNGGISYSNEKGTNGNTSGLGSKAHAARGMLSAVPRQNKITQSRVSHVKLRIKSFRVPELFIDIPETATVGLLKRRVMDAVTSILRGGLRVGVLHQGKRVGDDNKTLLQSGISHNNQLDALGFALEPNSDLPLASPSLRTGDTLLAPLDKAEPLTRLSPPPAVTHQASYDMLPDNSMTNLTPFAHHNDRDSAPSLSDMCIDKTSSDSKALISVTPMSVRPLAIIPINQKSKHSDPANRRIRRPFSVSEVEALVEAVETLGTGRWRDIKMRAFVNAKHRTYVDLKDKWKTLVHTAKISPHQRRGQPVPQELLDRVLTCHAYWMQVQLINQLDTGMVVAVN